MAITKHGNILIKVAVSRWKDFINNLSSSNRNRIFNSGIAKKQDAYINGINRGTVNILKRNGYTRGNISGLSPAQISKNKSQIQSDLTKARILNNQIIINRNADAQLHQTYNPYYGTNPLSNRVNPNSWSGMSTVPYWKSIYTKGAVLPNGLKKPEDKRLFNALANRHEAYETSAAEKAYANYLKNTKKGDRLAVSSARKINPAWQALTDQEVLNRLPIENRAALGVKTPGILQSTNTNRKVGSHLNIDVLDKERKLLDTYPYNENKAIDFFRNTLRKDEYKYMDRAGEYTAKQAPAGFLSRIFSSIKNKFGNGPVQPSPSLERFNKRNYRLMTRKMRQGVPVEVNPGEYWTPLF